jgi:ribosomal protein S27AE
MVVFPTIMKIKIIKNKEIKICKNCGCMTNNKKGYIYICGKCGKDRRRKVE